MTSKKDTYNVFGGTRYETNGLSKWANREPF